MSFTRPRKSYKPSTRTKGSNEAPITTNTPTDSKSILGALDADNPSGSVAPLNPTTSVTTNQIEMPPSDPIHYRKFSLGVTLVNIDGIPLKDGNKLSERNSDKTAEEESEEETETPEESVKADDINLGL